MVIKTKQGNKMEDHEIKENIEKFMNTLQFLENHDSYLDYFTDENILKKIGYKALKSLEHYEKIPPFKTYQVFYNATAERCFRVKARDKTQAEMLAYNNYRDNGDNILISEGANFKVTEICEMKS